MTPLTAEQAAVLDALDAPFTCASRVCEASATHAVTMVGRCCPTAVITWQVCPLHIPAALDAIVRNWWRHDTACDRVSRWAAKSVTLL